MTLAAVAEAAPFVDLAGLLVAGEVDGRAVDFLSWGFYAPSVWRNRPHTHSFHEVCLAYAGSGTFTVDGEEHPVAAGDLFIARPGQVHRIVSHSEDGLGIAFWGFALQAAGSLPVLVPALAAEAAAPRSGVDAQVRALGAALVIETARAFAAPEDLAVALDPGARTTSAVAAMQRYLADNLERPLQVQDVAATAHLSTRHAARLFARETGESVMGALRRLRLERAAHRLLESEEPAATETYACGYGEVRAFITAFRLRYGQPPGAFRRSGGTLHL